MAPFDSLVHVRVEVHRLVVIGGYLYTPIDQRVREIARAVFLGEGQKSDVFLGSVLNAELSARKSFEIESVRAVKILRVDSSRPDQRFLRFLNQLLTFIANFEFIPPIEGSSY